MSLVFEVHFDEAAYRRLLLAMQRIADKSWQAAALHEAGLLLEREIAMRTHVRTGAARGSVKLVSFGPSQAVVASSLHYVPVLEEGSKAHIIRPVHAKVLAWKSGSHTMFAKVVKHPGTRGLHMFREGVAAAGPKVAEVFMKHLEAAAK